MKKKRAPSPPTTRQTSGSGFTFEDLTAAWFWTKILTGESLPGVGPGATQIQSQTDALKWQIDDLLISSDGPLETHHLAVSCKSNIQVTANRLPPEFVKRAWAQWREPDSPMCRKTDSLALVTQGQHPTFTPRWSDILNWCAGEDVNLAIERIRRPQTHVRIFDSIKTPGEGFVATDEETVELIRHLVVIPLDFQHEPSTSKEESISRCRTLLSSGRRDEAEAVWAELVRLATETRTVKGSLRLSTVWETLKTKFRLKDLPNFESSWNSLHALTKDSQAQIETELPSGVVIDRVDDMTNLAELLQEQLVTVVFGESGSGKSAVVKNTLSQRFPNWIQIWLGPEQTEAATSELNRSQLQLSYPLKEILQASASTENVLVLDSAERLNTDAITRVRQLIQGLCSSGSTISNCAWRIVIICQSEGWRDRLQAMIGHPLPKALAVERIKDEDVRLALRASDGLQWLSTRDDVIAVLTNLRALGWVIQASTVFQDEIQDLNSLPAITDRIWDFWTEGKAETQSLLIRLAVREAEFEPSFALSELDVADAVIFQNKPTHLPLHKNRRNRIEFEHDLAADWARFQRLKEIADDMDQWSAMVNNPLWSGALRLFGQLLLREPSGSSIGWDSAFSTMEEKGETLAADVLLDALFLDPQAERFLRERAEMLFANYGVRLNRLLRRFLHIATVPSAPPPALHSVDRALALYIEDKYRTPIIGLWPAMTHFLYEHIQQVAELVSPTVSKVCETWLTTTPLQLADGTAMPFRREFSEIALATARAVQVDKSKGIIYTGDGERPIYSAPLTGSGDLPDEVGMWALEMAKRRPQDMDVTKKVNEAKIKAAADHAERLRIDPEFRARQEELAKMRTSHPTFIPNSRKLPPWPMGPIGQVERDFQELCLHSQALGPLMHVRPELASEVLLALMIEGNPEEEYSRSYSDRKVGLAYDGDGYPTAYWKSQFFSFLHIAPEVALTTLIRLVNFCTERWAHELVRDGECSPPRMTITIGDGSEKAYTGSFRVFDWTQGNSNFVGQLHCALNALERWLTLKIEEDTDVEPYLERILLEGSSLAFIGLLVNVAKYRPALLSGVLMPLLSSDDVFWFDQNRVKGSQFQFDVLNWSRAGEVIFNMARDWTLASYRQRTFVQVVSEIIPQDKPVATLLKTAIEKWVKPDGVKAGIEFDIMCAQLDEANYRIVRNTETGVETVEFKYPAALELEVTAFQQAAAPKLESILLSNQCERVLQGSTQLENTEAQILADALSIQQTDEDDDEGRLNLNQLAAAATLIANAQEWLKERPSVLAVTESLLRTRVDTIGDSYEDLRDSRFSSFNEELKFAAYGVFYLWQQSEDESEEWEQPLLRILTSGDEHAVQVLGVLAYRYRVELGTRWWRLMQLGSLWSALSMFGPNYGDPPNIKVHWERWIRWLRARRISGASGDDDCQPVNLLDVWRRLNRLERARWRRSVIDDPDRLEPEPEVRSSHSLNTTFLDNMYVWLLADNSRPEGENLEVGHQILLALWSYEVAYCSEHRDERGEYSLPYQFGYNILAKLAFYAAHVTRESASEIWRGVLGLGPDAHLLVEHFIRTWFIQLNEGCNPTDFCKRWRDMIEFSLDANWTEGRHWFYGQRMMQTLLGFGSETSLANLPEPAHSVHSMRDLYQRWSEANLAREEENVATFSNFLASKVGAALRIDGLKWLAAIFEGEGCKQYWRDRAGTGDALVNLLNTAVMEDTVVFGKDQEAREALLALAAYVAARQVPAALALQEQIRHL